MIVEGYTKFELVFPDPEKSDSYEENLFIFGPRALDDFYRYPHAKLMEKFDLETNMDQMMFMLPKLAEYFGVKKDSLLEQWTQNYGIMYAMRDRK